MWRTFLLLVFIFPGLVGANVVITEVMCNPLPDFAEWVKVSNTGEDTVDVASYTFFDNSTKTIHLQNGSFLLASGESAFILDDDAINTINTLSGSIYVVSSTGLNNGGERIGFGTEYITYSAQSTKGELCTIEDRETVDTTTDSDTTTDTDTSTVEHTTITTYKEVQRWETVEIQPPQDITIRDMDDKEVLVGSNVNIALEVYDSTGKTVSPKCHIIFGDGSESKSCDILHAYEFAGTYIVTMFANNQSLHSESNVIFTVKEPELQINIADDYKFIEIFNNANSDARLSGWAIKVGYRKFTIPNNTIIPANESIKISANTLGIDIVRRGGVAHLIDVFGTVVADSSEYVAMRDITDTSSNKETITQGETLKQEDVEVQSNKQEEVQQLVLSTNIQKAPYTTTSIIGMQIPTVRTSDSPQQTQNTVIAKESVINKHNVQQLAATSAVQDTQLSLRLFDVLPQESGKWLIGLLTLLGIASLPVLIGRHDDVADDSDTHKQSEEGSLTGGFTVKEIK